jgi:hypothetical protein
MQSEVFCLSLVGSKPTTVSFKQLTPSSFDPGQELPDRAIVGDQCVSPDRDPEKLEELSLVEGPVRSMRNGAGKDRTAERAGSEAGIAVKTYTKESPFGQT